MGRCGLTLSEAQRAEVETLAAVLSSEQIADYLGIARRTFYDIMARDADVAARYKRGRARAVGSIAQSLITKARGGNVTAMIFFLKTQGGWRETIAVAPAPDPDALVIDVTALSDGTLAELMAVMERATAAPQVIEGQAMAHDDARDADADAVDDARADAGRECG
jgi:hypothetical protein